MDGTLDYEYAAGDTLQTWGYTCKVDDEAYSLTGHTVRIRIYPLSVGAWSEYAATVVSAAAGTVSFAPSDAAIIVSTGAGFYGVVWEVTRTSDGKILTFPDTGYLLAKVHGLG